MEMLQSPQLWIALLELRPRKRQQLGVAGMFTIVVTWARDLVDLSQKALQVAAGLDSEVATIEGHMPYTEHCERYRLSPEVRELEKRALPDPKAVVHGTLHPYFVDH